MRYHKSKILTIVLSIGTLSVLASTSALGAECHQSYRVKKGDTLTGIIAHRLQKLHKQARIYGSDGLLKQVLDLNSGRIENADLIFPDTEIQLPAPIVVGGRGQSGSASGCETKNAEEPQALPSSKPEADSGSGSAQAQPAAVDSKSVEIPAPTSPSSMAPVPVATSSSMAPVEPDALPSMLAPVAPEPLDSPVSGSAAQ